VLLVEEGPAVVAVTRRGCAPGVEDAAAVLLTAEEATILMTLPDNLLEMVQSRLPLSSLLAARCRSSSYAGRARAWP
jgi:hypothetical protein